MKGLPLFSCLLVPAATAHDLANVELTLTEIATGSALVDMQAPPDGSNRLFTLDITGTIRILNLDDNSYAEGDFMKVPAVDFAAGERGAYSLAFHPDFAENGHFYVHFATGSGGFTANRVSRFTAQSATTADPGSQLVIFEELWFSNFHLGGSICFGPDGFLYIAYGDDLGNGDARSAFDPKGKILRLDVDQPDSGRNYGIPAGNPFAGSEGFERKEVFAIGLRNPWRISFDRASGDLFIADVGEDRFEEVSVISVDGPRTAPFDFGWPYYEGNEVFDNFLPEPAEHTAPVHTYGHANLNRSITGGYVCRGVHPRLDGVYLYGDYISGRIWGLAPDGSGGWTNRELHHFESLGTTTFGQDNGGEVYVFSPPFIYRLGDTAVVPTVPFAITAFGISGESRFSLTASAPSGTQVSLQRYDAGSAMWETLGEPATAADDRVTLTDTTRLAPADAPTGIYRAITADP